MSTITISKPTGEYHIETSNDTYRLLPNIKVEGGTLGFYEAAGCSGNTLQIDGIAFGGYHGLGVHLLGKNTRVEVGYSGTISSYQGTGILMEGAGETLVNGGSIYGGGYGDNGYAVKLTGRAGTVINNNEINSFHNAIELHTNSFTVVNRAHIISTAEKAILVSDADARITLTHGSVTEGNIGILVEDGTGHAVTVTNAGAISGTSIEAINSGDAILKLGNSGSIEGLVTAGTRADRISNSGTIDGVIDAGGGRDIVVNTGAIGGYMTSVNLGTGNDRFVNSGSAAAVFGGEGKDTFDIRGGTVGSLNGGAGNDVYLLKDASVKITEGAMDGKDMVKSTVSYTLASDAELENLTLTGKNNIDGTGNGLNNHVTGNTGKNKLFGMDGADTLSGGKGADLLTGGADADTFVFRSHFGKDKIADFENTVDHVDLSHWSGVDSFADLKAHHLTVSGNDLVIHNGTDMLTLVDTKKGELDASDFVF
jgi:Ca2+-binding RTX toxin-like protein